MSATDRFGHHGVSRIEFAKRLKGLRAVISQDEYESIASLLLPPDQRAAVERAMDGLTQEEEFAVLSHLMGTAVVLIPLEQVPILGSPPGTPDFLATFRTMVNAPQEADEMTSARSCFVEVKSTKKDVFAFGGEALRRLRAVATQFRVDLIFAIRFVRFDTHPVWALVEDDGSGTSVNADLNDIFADVRERLWGDVILVMKDGIVIESHYSANFPYTGFSHNTYGNIGKLIVHGGSQTYELTGGDLSLVASFLRVFRLKQVSVESVSQDSIISTRETIGQPVVSKLDIIYQLNRMSVGEDDLTLYDPPRLIAKADQGILESLIDRRFVDPIIDGFVSVGLVSRLSYSDFRRVADERATR